MTRTHLKHWRVYCNGLDFSGYARSISPINWTFGAEPDTALTDGVKNILIGQGDVACDGINAFLDNTASSSIHANLTQTTRNVMIPFGANAAPVAGNPCFCWAFEDSGYKVEPGTGFVAATLPFGGSAITQVTYERPWGVLLHAKGAETAVNSSTGIDDTGASSALGGLFAYQLFTSNGTVTLKAQSASTNSDGSFSDIALATSGVINASTTPVGGIVALGTTTTINRYIRWQLVLGTASSVTFACALVRNTITT